MLIIALFILLSSCSLDKMREQGFKLGFVRGTIEVPNIPFHREPFSEDSNGRVVYFVGPNGKFFEINVTRVAIIRERCSQDALGCTLSDGSKIVSVWMIDSFAVALHQCARIFAIDAGWTPAFMAKEFGDDRLGEFSLPNLLRAYGDKPANREPCGPSPYYTNMGWQDWFQAVRYGGNRGGRLLTLEEWKWLMAKEGLDGSQWK